MADLSFGQWLKRRRGGLGLTQAELAQAVGYSVETVRKLESDRLRPSKTLARQLAETLQLPPDQHAAFIRFARDQGDLPDLPVQTPTPIPARATPSPPTPHHNLPTPATQLVGRDQERSAVLDLLARPDTRLVTITGPGGTGKTRLALEVAWQIDDVGLTIDTWPIEQSQSLNRHSLIVNRHFADGVFFVNLAPIREPALVVSAVAQALGVREAGGRPLLDSLKDFLREKHLLLLLDNFEQVAQAAPLVGDLLQAAPGLKALVTSRAPLRLNGEYPFPLSPLPLPAPPRSVGRRAQDMASRTVYATRVSRADAVRLFRLRASVVRPDFDVTPDNAATIAQLCIHLDGLPLALELAAARIRLLTPEQMLARLEGRAGHRPLAVLKTATLDLPARQQTLWNTMAWSYDLLAPAEQALFRRLAVFAGGWTLEAAEAVCAFGDEGPMTEDGGQTTEDQGRKTKDQPAQHPLLDRPSSVLRPDDVLDGLESLLGQEPDHRDDRRGRGATLRHAGDDPRVRPGAVGGER